MRFSMDLNMKHDSREYNLKMSKVLFFSMQKIVNLSKDKAPSNTAQLRRSIHLFPRGPDRNYYEVRTSVGYAAPVEFGSAPHYPPIEPLKDWAKRVLHEEQAAYAVQKKIGREGTEPQPFFRPALNQARNKWVPYYYKRVFQE